MLWGHVGYPSMRSRLDPSTLARGWLHVGGPTSLEHSLMQGGLVRVEPDASTIPTLSVIIPTYEDTAQRLRRCLHSLASDIHGPAEVIIVCDGRMGAPESLRELAHEANATILELGFRGGPSAARNAGAAHSTGDTLLFLDSDVRLGNTSITLLARHLQGNGPSFCAPRVLLSGGDPKARSSSFELDMGPRWAEVHRGGIVPYVPSAALLVRRDAFMEIGGFDEGLFIGEDVDLVRRITEHGTWGIYDPDIKVYHERRSSISADLGRSFRYGLSTPDLDAGALDGNARVLLLAPLLGPVGLLAPIALERVRARRSMAQAAIDVDTAQGIALRRSVWAFAQWTRDLRRTSIAPLAMGSVVSRRVRRFSIALIVAGAISDLRRFSDPPREVLDALLHDLAYSSGSLLAELADRMGRSGTSG